MESYKTSLSVGYAIVALLHADAAVAAITGRVFPLESPDERLPYIAYRRASVAETPTKSTDRLDTITVDLACYAADYDGSLALAEAVRHAIDVGECVGYRIRACRLTAAVEARDGNAFVQILTYEIKL